MTDKIIIKNLKIESKIGITCDERKYLQPLIIDTIIFTDLKKSGFSDKIEDTINYSTICKEIILIIQKEFETIECVAETIAQNIKQKFNVEKLRIKVKKPKALLKKGAQYAAVEIER